MLLCNEVFSHHVYGGGWRGAHNSTILKAAAARKPRPAVMLIRFSSGSPEKPADEITHVFLGRETV